MSSFQDETPVYVHLETDVGALTALIDDPILLRPRDERNFYTSAKLRGIGQLKSARDGAATCFPLPAVATLIECERCHSGPGESCWSEAGDAEVPIHQVRKDQAAEMIEQIENHYAARGEKLDG